MAIPFRNDLSIGAVERETGLSKDTLRVWERRYSFPSPGRDVFGERQYPPGQVEKLRLIKNLIDHGYRPGKLIGFDVDVLRGLTVRPSPISAATVSPCQERDDLLQYVALCKTQRIDELRRELSQGLLRLGMYRFVMDVIAPLTTMIGMHWQRGDLAVYEEHLYTEAVQAVMRSALTSIPAPDTQTGNASCPRIVLTTLPHEPHGLGLLMAEAIFAIEGAYCISLGVQTPVAEIVQAARNHEADIVALSISPSCRPAQVLPALADLGAALAAHVEIWAGGRCAALRRRLPVAVKRLELDEISKALTEWRRRLLRP